MVQVGNASIADKIFANWSDIEDSLITFPAEKLIMLFEQMPPINFSHNPDDIRAWDKVRHATREEIIRRMKG